MSIEFSRAPNRPTFRSSSPPNSCSPSISRRRNRLVSKSRRPFSPAPTRSLNRKTPLPLVARNGHADHVARRPLSGAKRKTYARIELFRFWPQTDMPWQGGDGAVKGRTDVQREPGRLRFDPSRPPTVRSVFSFGPLAKLVRGPCTEGN